MGLPKAMLPFGPETMLQRVARLLDGVVQRTVVVAAPRQTLPALPGDVLVVRDRREGRGPLEGLAAGLAAIDKRDAAFVTACDAPLLVPALVERMFALLADYDAVVPLVDGQYHPLSAVYRGTVRGAIDALLAADQLRMQSLLGQINTRDVSASELAEVDPELRSLRNCNRREDYRAALAIAGFDPPPGFQRG